MNKIGPFLLLVFGLMLNSMPIMAYTINYQYDYNKSGTAMIYSVSGTIEGDFVIPSTVTHDGKEYVVDRIGANAFYHQDKMTSVTIPSAITTIDNNAFDYCLDLVSFTLPNTVTKVGESILKNCRGLETIIVEEGNPNYDSRGNCNAIIETASNKLIQGCATTVVPNGLTTIGAYAFRGFNDLEAPSVPNTVTIIEEGAFANCYGLESLDFLPNSITEIGASAFNGSHLKSIHIPEGVTTVGEAAFESCYKAESLIIPSTLTNIGSAAFSNCFGLISVSIAEGNPVYDSRDNCNAFIETATNTLVQGFDASTIPSGVVAIADYAFYRCTGILELTIPEGVTTLGKDAFNDCRNMTSIVIPTSVTTIKAEAFRACSSLPNICIPGNVTTIESYTFDSCTKAEYIALPATVTSIDRDAFYNCKSLTDIYFAGTETQWKAILGLEKAAIPETTVIHYGAKAPSSISSVIEETTTASPAFDLWGRQSKENTGFIIQNRTKLYLK